MVIVHDNIDSDDGLDFNLGFVSHDNKMYFDDHVTVKDNSITIYNDSSDNNKAFKNKIYFISSINSIEIIEKNILLKELLLPLLTSSVMFLLIVLGMGMYDASHSSVETLFKIFIGIYIFYAIFTSYSNYSNKFFIQISTSTGKKYIYFSKYASKINDIFNVIVGIKNSK
jgi:hypothetical protein